jgi:hypothetical protein
MGGQVARHPQLCRPTLSRCCFSPDCSRRFFNGREDIVRRGLHDAPVYNLRMRQMVRAAAISTFAESESVGHPGLSPLCVGGQGQKKRGHVYGKTVQHRFCARGIKIRACRRASLLNGGPFWVGEKDGSLFFLLLLLLFLPLFLYRLAGLLFSVFLGIP